VDRKSFISRSYVNNPGTCQLESCKCEEPRSVESRKFEKVKPLHLVAITAASFVFAVVFAIAKKSAAVSANAEWFLAKQEAIVSCTPDESPKKNRSFPNDSGNSCPHQQPFLSNAGANKRFKIHSC